ncbi:MAG: 4Fe-4S binding protein [Chlamydiales bacterium]|nr:4Fe-4S binding protein [Chlamydiales bacterium]
MNTKKRAWLFWQKRRYLSQFLVLFTFFLLPTPLPFLGLDKGLLKLDFNEWLIHFLAVPLPKELFYLFFLAILLVLVSLFVYSAIYGKFFCGWICPQNIYFEFLENVHKKLRKRFPFYRKSPKYQKGLDLTLTVIFASLTSWNINRYFLGLAPIFQAYITIAPFIFFVLLVHVFKHRFCQNACPIAIFQKSLQDEKSLHISYDKNRKDKPCGVCYACEKACYVNIDIKQTPFHIDCTLCGACVDACSQVYRKKSEESLLSFSFESQKLSFLEKIDLNQRFKQISFFAFLILLTAYCSAFILRPELYTHIQSLNTKSSDKQGYQEFSLFTANLSQKEQTLILESSAKNFSIEKASNTEEVMLAPLERKRSVFRVVYTGPKDPNKRLSEISLQLRNKLSNKIELKENFYFHH